MAPINNQDMAFVYVCLTPTSTWGMRFVYIYLNSTSTWGMAFVYVYPNLPTLYQAEIGAISDFPSIWLPKYFQTKFT